LHNFHSFAPYLWGKLTVIQGRREHQFFRLERYASAQIDHVTNLMKACEKGTAPMVEALLSYPGINLLKTDARQLHAGFYAVENKSREDS